MWGASTFLLAALVLTDAAGGAVDAGTEKLVAVFVVASAFLTTILAQPAVKHLPAIRMWSATATEFIRRPPEQVWEFIRPAETSPSIQPKVHRGFTVPGTPTGLGEQQCFIATGEFDLLVAAVIEVVDDSPPNVTVVRNVTGLPETQRFEVAPAPGGAMLTYTLELSAERWLAYRIHPKKQAETAAAAYTASVKRLMEAQPVR